MVKKLKKQVIKQAATPSSESSQVTLQLSGSFSGPLPPPSLLQEYENILPGMAERLVATFEKEANHRHTVELTGLNAAITQVKRGQKYGLIIGCLALIASIISVAMGAEKTATMIGGSTVVGLVAVFVIGKFIPSK